MELHNYGERTVHPVINFNPLEDARNLREAMKGLGTDEGLITDVLAHRSNLQRQQIASLYGQEFGRDLVDDLKSDLGGKYETLIVAMMTPVADYQAKLIHDAVTGLRTDEDAIIEGICCKSYFELDAIKSAYRKLFDESMEDGIKSGIREDLQQLLVEVITDSRDEMTVNLEQARNVAQQLFNIDNGKLVTDADVLYKILSHEGWAQLSLIFSEYTQIAGETFEDSVTSETSGVLQKALMTIVKCARNKAEFFAERLHSSMSGFGTRDHRLIRLIVGRSEIDLGTIRRQYEQMYGKSLEDAIESDTSGTYKKALLAILQI